MSFHDSELSKFRTKIKYICKFLKFPHIPAENSAIPGNSRWPCLQARSAHVGRVICLVEVP